MGQILHGRRRTVGASHVAGRRGWSHLWPAVVIIVVVLLAFYQLAADVYSVSVLRDTLIFGLFALSLDFLWGCGGRSPVPARGRHPPRLIFRKPLGYGASARLAVIVEIAEGLASRVVDDEALCAVRRWLPGQGVTRRAGIMRRPSALSPDTGWCHE